MNIYISLICRGIKEGEESKKAEAERDGAKRTMAGRGRVMRGSPAIINAASAAIIHFPEARKSGIFEASARGGARGSRSGWPTDKVSSKRHCTIKTIVTLLEVKICPRSGSRT